MHYPDPLTQEQRIDLKEKLQLIAKWYFTREQHVCTSCGICYALTKAFGNDDKYYAYIASLLYEIYQDHEGIGYYSSGYEAWESRAYMCLFLVEYLDSTIDLKSSEILRKASVLLTDSLYDHDTGDWSCYICDCIRMIKREIDSTEATQIKCTAIRSRISQLIEGKFSLIEWIEDNGHATWNDIVLNPKKMQQTRYNMMLDLIAYYESKGD